MNKKIKCEIYKDIPSCIGYQASNFGNIKSVKDGHVLPQKKNNSGYMTVSISIMGKHFTKTVHRLVAETFLNNFCNKRDVNHKDGNKENNFINNLEWVSHSENIKHSHNELTRKSTKKPIICVDTGEIFDSCKDASIITGINVSSINHAINGRSKQGGGYKWKRI